MKARLSLAQAERLANKIVTALSPACELIQVAGSIRRRKKVIGDIEIVAVPRLIPGVEQLTLLDGEPPLMVSALDGLIEKLLQNKPHLRRVKNGELYKAFVIGGTHQDIGLDLFLTTKAQWGYILALRTGPAEFTRAMVTPQSRGGLLQDGYRFAGGWLYKGNERIPTPAEEDIFTVLGNGDNYHLSPQYRDRWQGVAK